MVPTAGRSRTCVLVMAIAAAAFAVQDCKAAQAQQISGPPTINQRFGTRNPRKCEPVKHLPSPAEAGALSQCYKDRQVSDILFLWQNLQVQMGAPRPYMYRSDAGSSDIDTTAKVYPIRVSADLYACKGEATCAVTHYTNAPGTCIKTTFGDYSCSFSSAANDDPNQTQMPRPVNY